MSSTGTRVVPTLTEVLDEQRLSKPASNLSTEAWPSGRRGDEELVPISLDWGDEAPAAEAAGHPADAGGVMTPWQVVQPRSGGMLPDETPFIDLSIDVAPVQAPALHEQVLEVFALPPAAASEPVGGTDGAWPAAELEAAPLRPADRGEPALDAPLAPGRAHGDEGGEGGEGASALTSSTTVALVDEGLDTDAVDALEPAGPAPESVPAPAPASVPALASAPPSAPAAEPAHDAALPAPAAPVEVPAAVLNMLAAAGAAAAMAPPPSSPGVQGGPASSPPLDPGMHAVRQGGEHVPGISEDRLQAILQQALDRLLRDELPSALVETLIRLSPQLSESLIESLKPSLHLHVMEALSAESLLPHEARSKA